MTAHLLLAPAAAGKTRNCLERIHSLLNNKPLLPAWVLLPDRNQAAAFRRRLSQTGGALGVWVGTFDDLYAEVLALADASIPVAPEPVLHRLVRDALETAAGLNQLQHYASIYRRPGLALALADLFAELKRAHVTPELFKRAVAGRGRRLEELAELYGHYQSTLIRFGWADPEGLGWLAIVELQARPRLCAGWHVFVDGFDSFTFTQLETLELFESRAGSLTLTLTGEPQMRRIAHRRFKATFDKLQARLSLTVGSISPPLTGPAPLHHLEAGLFVSGAPKHPSTPQVCFIEAQTQALEAREALRWLKARVARDGVAVSSCAVIARDLTAYRPFLLEAAREFGLRLHMATGDSLAANPAVAAILNLLELPLRNWKRRPLLDALRTPYVDVTRFGFSPRDVVRLDDVARFGQVLEGLDQWREALEQLSAEARSRDDEVDEEQRPPALPRGEAARRLWRALERFSRRITPPATAAPKDFARWLEDVVDEVRLEESVRSQPETAGRDEGALAIFRNILRASLLSDEIPAKEQSLSFEGFYSEIRGAISAAAYIPHGADPPDAIYASNLSMARGVPYEAVAILGLSEGLFPAPIDEDPFLSDEDRFRLGEQGLPLEPRLRSDQQSLFYGAVAQASEYILLTRPYLADDGEVWEPSPYWNAALELFDTTPARVRVEHKRAIADAASSEEVLEFALQHHGLPDGFDSLRVEWDRLTHALEVLSARLASRSSGLYEGDLAVLAHVLSSHYGPAHIWSASRLESYGVCNFQFYIGAALGLERREAPKTGFDSTQLGSILHAILERVYQAADASDVEALIAVLPTAAEEVFKEAPRNLGFRPTPLWTTKQRELLAALEATIRSLADQAGDFRVVELERRFDSLIIETAAGAVRLRGVIDRVDRNPAGQLRVIDYKTGASHLDRRALVDGRRLQLPLYAAAAARVLNLGNPAEGLYWAVLKGEAGRLSLATFEHTDDDGSSFVGFDGALELAAGHIGRSVLGIRAGAFAPLPPPDGCSDYCPAKDFCWRYRPGW